jgi:hypothetical protein
MASARTKPALANDDKRDVGLGQCPADVFTKINPERDVIDIPKDAVASIPSRQAIKYPPRDGSGILSSI